MLVASLGLAVLGFAALLVALYLGSVTWAWICVIIAAIGVLLSFAEAIQHRKSRK
ncbi:hypothetical protein [Corynebacterium urealyticum]|uniref:Uncharacterized protein n=1 Tax=Corynebacterium urealyticum (strain ATCC 43042 / DSM 7109) TaxID=504474 RepID=B1VHB5_CORU7|nr:hypothetical protein [Corynebacterium urealyticum]AGE36769.1 hypothetical protein CU7111_1178 [Corynebacterium urealyticum DSM 7111]QQB08390.1 hypothetical protein I6H53_04610 [Corynebacterium urealyticum]QQC41422.1 hypothetical protein I6H51_06760 [Corynebacterium urealyticum]CAQ05156.1 hypothetical protein cu1196 [Corynebacterium urealyticum DSM 7109]SNV85960.1 Uncharacterised protein [Corynebacterium urealyticum]